MSWGQAQIDALVQTLTGESRIPQKDIEKLIQNFAGRVEKIDRTRAEYLRLIVQPHEKRKDLRVPININLEISEVIIGNHLVTLKMPMAARAIDLSSSGIRLASVIEVPATSFFFCFPLILKDQSITCVAEVVRREYLHDIPLYGCQFINLEAVDKNRIRNFVFHEQIRLRKKDAQQI